MTAVAVEKSRNLIILTCFFQCKQDGEYIYDRHGEHRSDILIVLPRVGTAMNNMYVHTVYSMLDS